MYKKKLSLVIGNYDKATAITIKYQNLCKIIIKYKNLPEITQSQQKLKNL